MENHREKGDKGQRVLPYAFSGFASIRSFCINLDSFWLKEEVTEPLLKQEAPNGRKWLQTAFVSVYAQQVIYLKGRKTVPSSFSSRKLFMEETTADSFLDSACFSFD